jgi:hypothetical protein
MDRYMLIFFFFIHGLTVKQLRLEWKTHTKKIHVLWIWYEVQVSIRKGGCNWPICQWHIRNYIYIFNIQIQDMDIVKAL